MAARQRPGALRQVRQPVPAGPGRYRVLLSIGALYAGFGVVVALLQGGLPPILRARGLSMQDISWTFALYLPLGLAFIWAPLVDRCRLPFLSPRVGWIVLAQLLVVAGLVAVALLEQAPLGLLFGLGLLVAFAVATMDLALDAMAVEMTGTATRPLAAALKLAALALGAMIGGGVFVGMLARFGWMLTFALVAALMLLVLLPVLTLTAYDRVSARGVGSAAPVLYGALRDPATRRRLGVLMLIAALIFPLTALNRVMLVDLGVSLDRIAWLVGTAQPLGMLLVSLAAAPLIRVLGSGRTFMLWAFMGLLCLLAMAWGYRGQHQDAAIAGTVVMAAVVGGMMVVNASLMLSWSEGSQVATSYAVLFCGTRLASIIATILAGRLLAVVDWLTFYGLGAAALLLAVGALHVGLRIRSSGARTAPG